MADAIPQLEVLGRRLYGEAWSVRLAEALGVSQSHVYALRAGRRTWTDDLKVRMRAALDRAPIALAAEHANRLVAVRDALVEVNRCWGPPPHSLSKSEGNT